MEFNFTETLKIGDERVQFYGLPKEESLSHFLWNLFTELSEKNSVKIQFTVNIHADNNGINFADVYFTKIYIEIYSSHKGEIILFNNSPNDFELENLLEFQTDGTLLIDRVEIDFRNKRISIA